ncbi:MAG: 50S ribosomal protein L32 [Oscillospiraceae bacterium]|jgi:RNA polymerase subunit RPABC4/transcription elongation factor Spt4
MNENGRVDKNARCKNCGAEMDKSARVCPNCGTEEV